MTKLDIITPAPTVQVNPANGNGWKDTAIPVFKGKCEETRVHVFSARSALSIDAFHVTICEITEIIGRTYKNGGDVKMCLYGMKDINLP